MKRNYIFQNHKISTSMKLVIVGLCFLFITAGIGCTSQNKIPSASYNAASQQEIINLSKDKWQWMADKNIDKLTTLFHDKSKFVHMSGTWKKTEELDIIKSGS